MRDIPKPTKKILAIRLSAMGDVAMTVPVLRALTQQYPEVKITFITRALFKPFFRDLPNVSVFTADVKGEHKGVFGLYKLAKALNKQEFYVIADLHNVLRSKVLKGFLRCKRFVSIDKGRKAKRNLTKGEVFEPLKTTHQRYADVFKVLGYSIDLSNPTFPKPKKLNNKSIELLGIKNSKWIGIAPFATYQSKMYPLDLMKIVVESLSKEYKVLLFGGKDDNNMMHNFETSFDDTPTLPNTGIVNVVGKFDLDEELDIISNLDIMLTMDSGNAHMAAMLGVKVVTIWGVTHPYAGFAPFNQPEHYCLLADRNKFPKIPTSVYGNKYPESYINAAGSISPEVVIEKIKSIV
jgi:ADP-heptose:LPS heptosyltransferase